MNLENFFWDIEKVFFSSPKFLNRRSHIDGPSTLRWTQNLLDYRPSSTMPKESPTFTAFDEEIVSAIRNWYRSCEWTEEVLDDDDYDDSALLARMIKDAKLHLAHLNKLEARGRICLDLHWLITKIIVYIARMEERYRRAKAQEECDPHYVPKREEEVVLSD